MANSFTITLTPDEVTALTGQAHEVGIDTSRASGPLPEQDGVLMHYAITKDANGAVLTFTVDHKPFYVSMDAIEAHVKALIG